MDFAIGSYRETATIKVVPATIDSVDIYPDYAKSGRDLSVRVYFDGKLPANATTVRLHSSNPDLIPLPETATLVKTAGVDYASLTVKAGTATATTQVAVRASYAGKSAWKTVTIAP